MRKQYDKLWRLHSIRRYCDQSIYTPVLIELINQCLQYFSRCICTPWHVRIASVACWTDSKSTKAKRRTGRKLKYPWHFIKRSRTLSISRSPGILVTNKVLVGWLNTNQYYGNKFLSPRGCCKKMQQTNLSFGNAYSSPNCWTCIRAQTLTADYF